MITIDISISCAVITVKECVMCNVTMTEMDVLKFRNLMKEMLDQ